MESDLDLEKKTFRMKLSQVDSEQSITNKALRAKCFSKCDFENLKA